MREDTKEAKELREFLDETERVGFDSEKWVTRQIIRDGSQGVAVAEVGIETPKRGNAKIHVLREGETWKLKTVGAVEVDAEAFCFILLLL
jgi:hypothetical protein